MKKFFILLLKCRTDSNSNPKRDMKNGEEDRDEIEDEQEATPQAIENDTLEIK